MSERAREEKTVFGRNTHKAGRQNTRSKRQSTQMGGGARAPAAAKRKNMSLYEKEGARTPPSF